MGEAVMGCCCWICVGCPPIRFDCSLRCVVTRRRPMQYPERRHSRLETFKLDNVHILVTFFIGVHLRIIYTRWFTRQLRMQSNRFSSLILFWLLDLMMTVIFVFSFCVDQAKPPITCRLSFLFLAPQKRHNLQYPNKRWLAKIYMGVVKGEKTSAGLL